jgi:SET domain-containing protein
MIEKIADIAEAPRQDSSGSPSPPPPDLGLTREPFVEVRSVAGGRGVFARRAIAAGTRLFGEDDWADETERRSFSTLTPAQLADLKPELRDVFLRYGYNTAPERITGTFHPEAVRHPVNFINHACDPNVGYDGADDIVALRGIPADEEIRMDYGTFSFSFDHAFVCHCGAPWCRGKVTGRDWPELVRTGLRLPGFMRAQADRALWG